MLVLTYAPQQYSEETKVYGLLRMRPGHFIAKHHLNQHGAK